MNEKYIKTLIERFYNAQTTEEEEQALIEYFSKGDVPNTLSDEALFFNSLRMANIPEAEAHQKEIEKTIDQWNRVETVSVRRSRKVFLNWSVGIAAVVAIMFGVTVWLNHHAENQNVDTIEMADTYTNIEDAEAKTEEALMKFAVSLNKGMKKINALNRNNKSDNI